LIEHDLFGKPLNTFPDHALARTPSLAVAASATRPPGAELLQLKKQAIRCKLFSNILYTLNQNAAQSRAAFFT